MRGVIRLVLASASLLPVLQACTGVEDRTSRRAPMDQAELEFTERAVIGGWRAEGAAAFGSVRTATILPTRDRIAIVDGKSQEIRLFSSSGEHVRTIGGEGAGPGEFRALDRLWPHQDGGLCAWDLLAGRVTRFGESGEMLGSARADLSEIRDISPRFVGFLDDCSFVLEDRRAEMDMRHEPEGPRRDTVGFVLFDGDGRPVHELGSVVGPEWWFENRDGGWGWIQPIFGAELFTFVVGSRLWAGASDSLRWALMDLGGAGIDTLGFPVSSRRASSEDARLERERRIDSAAARIADAPLTNTAIDGQPIEAVLADRQRSALWEAPARVRLPAYDRVVAGPDGALWLRVFPPPQSSEATWVLLEQQEAFEGRITLPRAARLLAATRTDLLLGELDAMDAAVVRILRRGDLDR